MSAPDQEEAAVMMKVSICSIKMSKNGIYVGGFSRLLTWLDDNTKRHRPTTTAKIPEGEERVIWVRRRVNYKPKAGDDCMISTV